MGATPQRLAKAASLRSRSGLSPAATSSAPAMSGPTPLTARSSGAVAAGALDADLLDHPERTRPRQQLGEARRRRGDASNP